VNTYSLLMVDDEQEVIDVMVRKLDWDAMGFTVCGRAENGIEALELAKELQPDVVMMDIKMPFMDGLEVSSQLKQLFPDIVIIICSGFDEFEFAKEAIALGVEDYLLKPVDSDEIIRVLEKVHGQLDSERARRSGVQELEKYYKKSLPMLRENFLDMLVEGPITEERLRDGITEYKLDLSSRYYVVSVIHVSTSDMPENMSPRLAQLSVRQLCEEWNKDLEGMYIFNYRGHIVSITPMDDLSGMNQFTDNCARFCRLAKHSCKVTVTVGIGVAVTDPKEIYVSYKSAREAVSYRVLYGCGTAININEINPDEDYSGVDGDEKLQKIFKQIKMGSSQDVENAVADYTASLVESRMNINRFRLELMDTVTRFYKFCINNDVESDKIFGGKDDDSDLYAQLVQMGSADEIGHRIKEISLKIREELMSSRDSKTGSLIKRAEDYVRDNYYNPELTVDMVCSELNLSAAYFSTVFKKETGKTFITYLTDYRMKEAVRLLIEENEKTYIIAERVGYSDANYFSYVFKKQFGVSPTIYKRQGGSR